MGRQTEAVMNNVSKRGLDTKVTTIDELLHWFGDVWLVKAYNTDYKSDHTGDELLEMVEASEAEVKAQLEQLLIEARFNELQGLLDAYHTGAHPYDYINDRIKDLNNKAKGE